MTPELTLSFSGYAYPASPAEWVQDGFQHEPELERITGSFSVVQQDGDDYIVSNGEVGRDQKWWRIPWSEIERVEAA